MNMDPKELLKRRVIHVLRGTEAGRIRFTFPLAGGGTITISPQTFRDVSRAVEQGDIDVDPHAALPAGADAQYDPDIDTLGVASQHIGRQQEGVLLHECTHAWFDINSTNIGVQDDEAAAYVVDALYYRMSGVNPIRRRGFVTFANADRVAVNLLQQYQRGVQAPTVDPANWNSLRAAIAADPNYLAAVAQGSYTHNGLVRPTIRAVANMANSILRAVTGP
jgi:hypothetical protein